ncbi:uncharacterized protein LOC120775409 isoform X2 [Bactrocera tryoni]|uniref:uncharacterized protein LOC120775409 isoform X2 n=1 Tax=Bactrocera tryoni TaxID=59916 RepID=UPI001A98DB16|nr:uncharacterized protein LOC120775409 isoform X2 [Bactrocera tryoni]
MDAVMTEEACCSHKPTSDQLKILLKAINKVHKVHKLLIEAIIRLEVSSKSSSSSSFTDTDGEEVINMTDEVVKPSKDQHVSKDHRARCSRRGRDRSPTQFHDNLMSLNEKLEVLKISDSTPHNSHRHKTPEIVEREKRVAI